MPRKAPDNVQEMRVTFGTYERQFAKEVKTDIETGVKVATVSAVALPLVVGASAVAGLGLLGYGIYAGLNTFSLMDIKNPITSYTEKLKQDDGSYAGFILRGFMSVAEYNAIQEGGGGGDF
jgi:hypothetical protein|tara:strand:- start:1191 stop:1553 length:363 start_codon:yes stop_codon:yes gene_type:complete